MTVFQACNSLSIQPTKSQSACLRHVWPSQYLGLLIASSFNPFDQLQPMMDMSIHCFCPDWPPPQEPGHHSPSCILYSGLPPTICLQRPTRRVSVVSNLSSRCLHYKSQSHSFLCSCTPIVRSVRSFLTFD